MIVIVLINNNWEQVKDLSDIVRIVEENIGYEFAREVERICGEPGIEIEEENSRLESQVSDLKDAQRDLRKLFIEVLRLAARTIDKDERGELLAEFDSIINGEV